MPALAERITMPRPDDPDILEAVYQARKHGHPQETAAQAAAISQRTLEDWYRIGKEQLATAGEVRLTKEQARELGSHALFAWHIKQADWEMVEDNLAHIRKARGDNWQAAMTLLERRRPQDFGRNQRIDIHSEHVEVHRLELGDATLAVLERIAQLSAVKLIPESVDGTSSPQRD